MLARLGCLCSHYRGLVLAAWVVLLVLGVVFGGQVFSRVTEARGPVSYEASRGFEALESASSGGSTVLGVVDGVRPDDPAVRAGATRAAAACGRSAASCGSMTRTAAGRRPCAPATAPPPSWS